MSGPPQMGEDEARVHSREMGHGAGAMSGPPQMGGDEARVHSREMGHGAGARLASRKRRRGERTGMVGLPRMANVQLR
jgi:hypothetical protein